jgi:TonB family protein
MLAASVSAQSSRDSFHETVAHAAELSTLAQPNTPPFHLRLAAHDVTLKNPEYDAEIEVWWAAPDKWRRIIKSSAFTQIAAQNGLHYYESNSATDYLPYWLDELVQGSIAPIPVSAFTNVSADEDRPGCGNWEISHGSGDEMFSSYASMCFNPDGTAREIFAEPIGLILTGYQKFGNKQIARQLRVWPGDRSEVAATVTVLEPLEQWESSGSGMPTSRLFDVPEDTGLASRVRFVSLPESALAPSESSPRPPLSWPSSYTFPISGVIAVRVQIDRAGNVRGFPSAISKNQAINAGAVAQIKDWKFKPYTVDGSPVEVVTTLSVPFHLKYEPLGAKGKEFPPISFGGHMKQYRALSDLRTAGSKPFHLRASFVLGGAQAGKYEETWQSPDEWVRQVELAGGTLRETRTRGNTATKFHGDSREGASIRAVLSAMQDRFPDPRYSFLEADWGNSAVPASNVYPQEGADSSECVLIRAARGAVDANNHPTSGQAYWFDSEGLLRASFMEGMTVVNSDFSPWNLKKVPRRIELFIGATPTAVVSINSIDAL